jgi:putative spermidine/putrescine transport system ATP-binding protein
VASVGIEGLTKSFGGKVVLDLDRLEIADGEFFSLLGPSGCGKTTTLRCVAGSVELDGGRVLIAGRDVSAIPTHRRNLGMVFQKYALFPHMTVFENIAFGLAERGIDWSEAASRVGESLEMVALGGFQDRYPHQLSGGQQQRVAMARAIVYRPDVLLLDEPLSNLDVKLRVSMRSELKRLQRTLGITTIFVTHDQQEALVMSDRIAVMNGGKVEQVGTPHEIYRRPATAFVADFVGSTNLLVGVLEAVDAVDGVDSGVQTCRVRLTGGHVITAACDVPLEVGAAVVVTVKPERVDLTPCDEAPESLCGDVVSISYLGSVHAYVVDLGGEELEVRQPDATIVSGRALEVGARVSLEFRSPRVLPA